MRLAALLIMVALAMQAWGQRTTRSSLKPIADSGEVKAGVAGDTLYNMVDTLPVSVSGYEKLLRSRRESMFVTNKGAFAISALMLEIEYFDDSGRQLHKRMVQLRCDVPPGETRMVGFASWDKQLAWYYMKSEPPRTRFQATPYDVRVRVVYVVAAPAEAAIENF